MASSLLALTQCFFLNGKILQSGSAALHENILKVNIHWPSLNTYTVYAVYVEIFAVDLIRYFRGSMLLP